MMRSTYVTYVDTECAQGWFEYQLGSYWIANRMTMISFYPCMTTEEWLSTCALSLTQGAFEDSGDGWMVWWRGWEWWVPQLRELFVLFHTPFLHCTNYFYSCHPFSRRHSKGNQYLLLSIVKQELSNSVNTRLTSTTLPNTIRVS